MIVLQCVGVEGRAPDLLSVRLKEKKDEQTEMLNK